jgi:hypothetical protein
MKLKDCEIRELYVRGMAADVIFGRHAITNQEGAALLAEFRQLRPAAQRVAYLSRDGWQLLADPAASESQPAAEPAEPEPGADKPVAADPQPAAEPAPRSSRRGKKGVEA